MKKLMALAAIAVVGSTFAAQCGYTPTTPVQKTAWVYTWKFSGKTTEGAALKDVKVPGGACGYNGDTIKGGYVRVPASLKIQGYTYYCSPVCGSDDFETISEEFFYMTKPEKSYLEGGVTLEVSNIIGKKAKQFEMAGKANFVEFLDLAGADKTAYDLTFAGLGKYDSKNSRVSSVSGNFAGTAYPIWYVSNKVCAEAGYYDCETGVLKYAAPSVAFGKVSVKYNKSAAKRYLEGKKVAVKYPSWVEKQIETLTANGAL